MDCSPPGSSVHGSRQKYWSGVPLPTPHYPAKLSQLVGDVHDSGQGLEAEGMWTLLERMIWTTLSLVFSSLVSSAGERQGLGREGATSGAARIFPREGRSSYPSNQEVGSLVRTQEGRKKH